MRHSVRMPIIEKSNRRPNMGPNPQNHPKIKSCRIKLKIGMNTNLGMWNSKIAVPNPKNKGKASKHGPQPPNIKIYIIFYKSIIPSRYKIIR